MPEYQTLKRRYDLLTLFKTPELIVEVTTLPEKLLNIDASILFSDILMVLELFGKSWRFKEGVGPLIENPLKTENDIADLQFEQAKECVPYVFEAIQILKNSLKTPLIGFAGAPFTIASYMIEGGSSKDLKKTKVLYYQNPHVFHQLLEKITTATIDYLQQQIHAGVDAIQLFDSWTNVLSIDDFKELSLFYLNKICTALRPLQIPMMLFCKHSSFFTKELASINPHCISLDWHRPVHEIRKEIGPSIALQGNLDPLLLLGSKERIKHSTMGLLNSMKNDRGYIFNLGHGILPDTPFDQVKTLVDMVKEYNE